jgi:hypothetical protein
MGLLADKPHTLAEADFLNALLTGDGSAAVRLLESGAVSNVGALEATPHSAFTAAHAAVVGGAAAQPGVYAALRAAGVDFSAYLQCDPEWSEGRKLLEYLKQRRTPRALLRNMNLEKHLFEGASLLCLAVG